MKIRRYSELRRLESFEERFNYLVLEGVVGDSTFGFDRWMNQQFYRSKEWHDVRNHVIVRDNGCDLGIRGHEIRVGLLVHHMNPVTPDSIRHGEDWILDPEFLITVSRKTHNAIHFGGETPPQRPIVRKPGDTKLW